MNSNQLNLKQILPAVILMGLVGGCLLIGTEKIISMHLYFRKGWWIIVVYPIVMIPTMLILKANKNVEMNYLKSLLSGVLTFMLMTTVDYVWIITFINPGNGITLWGHTWRFLAMLGFALVSSALLGLFFIKRKQIS